MTGLRALLVIILIGAGYGVASGSGQSDHSTSALSVSSADTITPLVELYTSEGCSSCPPADRFLSRLGDLMADDNELRAVPLAFHVDYWNWLGWTDPFSQEQFTERQKIVASNNAQRSIYTPELVVAGKEARGGRQIYDWIATKNGEKASVDIILNVVATTPYLLEADVMFKNMASGIRPEVFYAVYENSIVRKIGGGENGGKTLSHDFVVRYWSQPHPVVAGNSNHHVSLGLDENWILENLGVAVVVVNPDSGETLQAVSTPLRSLYMKPESSG